MADRSDAGDGADPTGVPPETISTADLIDRAQHGDRAALDRLFARHYPPLRRWARGRLPPSVRDLTDTDDLVQEVLLRTFKRIGGFDARGGGALQAYLRQAILNRIRDHVRGRIRRPEVVALDENRPDDGVSPLEHAIGRETLGRYERALARLTPDEREAIIGRIELGMTYEELAAALGRVSSEAARKAAQRALVRLVEEMERDAG